MNKTLGQVPAFLRQSLLCVCALLLLSAPSFAQTGQGATDPIEHRDLYNLEHYIHVVPKTPADYHPITAEGRLGWFVRSTVGPRSLVAGLFSAGYGTATNRPSEYGTHWVGFGQRYGMRLTGVSTGNAIEAGLGAAWGEDPRYFHTVHAPFGTRVKNIVDLTFRAYQRDGERHPAYARFAATFGNNFLSNTWRVQSEADAQHALIRSAEGFGARALSNAFSEFFPQVWRKVRGKPDRFPADFTSP
ncbi:MAG: hypothetical protein WA655_20230 [Candidatus Korobacteraceae bacterium]